MTEYTLEETIQLLKAGNIRYIDSDSNPANNFIKTREYITKYGQKPYAVVVTCSDSRMAVEHIFSVGIGELFVVRTAGNIISDFDLGSIEFGCANLGAKVILVMGHTQCGAVAASMKNNITEGFLRTVIEEIRPIIKNANDLEEAIDSNIANSVTRVKSSPIIHNLIKQGKVQIISGKYDVETGVVSFQ